MSLKKTHLLFDMKLGFMPEIVKIDKKELIESQSNKVKTHRIIFGNSFKCKL